MPRLAANLSFLFTEVDFLDRFAAARDAGFVGVEFLFPYAWAPGDLKQRLDDNGLELALFNITPGDWEKGERGLAGLEGREDEFRRGVEVALHYARALGCRRLHAMAGLASHGADLSTYVHNLAWAAERARPDGIDILIEPINTFDMPGYLLSTAGEAAQIIAALGLSNVRLQLDLYHRHRMEGDALAAVSDYSALVAHYQIAGPPDRGEPVPSELDVPGLFAAIDATGFDGFVGCEYRPRAGTLPGLGWRALV
ncbi:MAG: 2-oxo-tetronate isomerase [Hyphomicrobiaceae bacterium]